MTREEAIQFLDNMRGNENGRAIGAEGFYAELCGYHVQALNMAIKALEQEPCEDAISKQTVIGLIEYHIEHPSDNFDLWALIDEIKDEPSVTPKQRTGHWEWVQYDYNPKLGNWHCSECRCIVVECANKEEKGGIPLYKYCPQCGTKMVEPQESEE